MKSRMTLTALVAAILIVAAAIVGCAGPGAAAATASRGWFDPLAVNASVDINGPAPNFTGVDVVTGKTILLQQFAGKAVLLNFVNYGCNSSLNNIVNEQLLARHN